MSSKPSIKISHVHDLLKKTLGGTEKKLYYDTHIMIYARNGASTSPIFCEEFESCKIRNIQPLQRLWEANLSDLNCVVGGNCVRAGWWQLMVGILLFYSSPPDLLQILYLSELLLKFHENEQICTCGT